MIDLALSSSPPFRDRGTKGKETVEGIDRVKRLRSGSKGKCVTDVVRQAP